MASGTIDKASDLIYRGNNPTGWNIDDVNIPDGWYWANSDQLGGTFPSNISYGVIFKITCPTNGSAMQFYMNQDLICYRQYLAGQGWKPWKTVTHT